MDLCCFANCRNSIVLLQQFQEAMFGSCDLLSGPQLILNTKHFNLLALQLQASQGLVLAQGFIGEKVQQQQSKEQRLSIGRVASRLRAPSLLALWYTTQTTEAWS